MGKENHMFGEMLKMMRKSRKLGMESWVESGAG